MATFKNKAIFYGGVTDVEGSNHRIQSTFHSDLYAFDLDRRRWFQLGLKAPKKEKSRRRKVVTNGESDDESNDDDDEKEEETAVETNSFGYIDENGNVVYIPLTEEDIVENAAAKAEISSAGPAYHSVSELDMYDSKISSQTNSAIEVESKLESKCAAPDTALSKPHVSIFEQMVEHAAPEIQTMSGESDDDDKDDADEEENKDVVVTPLSRYFSPEDTSPRGRMRPGMLVRGSTLYIYGGVTEFDDVEVMLDDCWSLDLNKRDVWKKLLSGTMHLMVWKSEGGGDTASEMTGGHDSEDEEEPEAELPRGKPEKTVAAQHVHKAGVRGEVEELRQKLAAMTATDDVTSGAVPLQGESLREFAK